MAKFMLDIDCANDAFGKTGEERRYEVARILERLVVDIRRNGSLASALFDANGLKVGSCGIKGKDEINQVDF